MEKQTTGGKTFSNDTIRFSFQNLFCTVPKSKAERQVCRPDMVGPAIDFCQCWPDPYFSILLKRESDDDPNERSYSMHRCWGSAVFLSEQDLC